MKKGKLVFLGKIRLFSIGFYAKQTQFAGSFQDTQNEHNLSDNSELYQ